MAGSGSSTTKQKTSRVPQATSSSTRTSTQLSTQPSVPSPDLQSVANGTVSPSKLSPDFLRQLNSRIGNQAANQIANQGSSQPASSQSRPAPLPAQSAGYTNARVNVPVWRAKSIKLRGFEWSDSKKAYTPTQGTIGSRLSWHAKIQATSVMDPKMRWRMVFHPSTDAPGFLRAEHIKFDKGSASLKEMTPGAPDKAPDPKKQNKHKKRAGVAGAVAEQGTGLYGHLTAPASSTTGAMLGAQYNVERADAPGEIASAQWGVAKPGEREDDDTLNAALTDFGQGLTGAQTAIGLGGSTAGAMTGVVNFVKEVNMIHQARKNHDWVGFVTQIGATSVGTGLAGMADLAGGVTSGIYGASRAAGADQIEAAAAGSTLGAVANGLRTVAGIFKLVRDSVGLFRKGRRGAAAVNDVATVGKDVMELIKSFMSTVGDVVKSVRMVMLAIGALKDVANTILGPIAAGITIFVSLVDMLIEALDLARRVYHLIKARWRVHKIKKDARYQQLLADLPNLFQASHIPDPESDPKNYHLLDDQIAARQATLTGNVQEYEELSNKRTLQQGERDRLKDLQHLHGFSSLSAQDRVQETESLRERKTEVDERQALNQRQKPKLDALTQDRLKRQGDSADSTAAPRATKQADEAVKVAHPQNLPDSGNSTDTGQTWKPAFPDPAKLRLSELNKRNTKFEETDALRLDALEEHRALGQLREFLMMHELITVNNKRFNRQITPAVTKLTNMYADFLSIQGAALSLVLTVTGSAAFGAGAAAGMGTSIATGVASAGIKLGGAGTLTGLKFTRKFKQYGRDKNAKGKKWKLWSAFNADKSSEMKRERRFRHAASLLQMASSLPPYKPDDEEIQGEYKRLEKFITVTGVNKGDFYQANGNVEHQVGMLIDALATRDADD